MSRLDQHIDAVRTRFLIQKLLNYGALTIAICFAALCVVVLFSRVFAVSIPPMLLLVAGAAALVTLISLVLATAYSPSRHATATKIDEVLGLKERYSTALYARGERDEFAQAAVSDAEHTANMVSIRKRFPMQWPRMAYPAMGAMLAVFLANRYVPQLDLFGQDEKARQQLVRQQKEEQARQAIEKALVEVNSIPKVSGEAKALDAAKRELSELLKNPIADPTEATVTAQRAMQQAEAARQRIEDVKTTAEKFEQADTFRPLTNSPSSGLFEDFKKNIAETKFEQAATNLQAAIDKFNKADAETQAKMAADMKEMAKQLEQIANDPSVQSAVQKQLEQAGATPEQARQVMREMEKAAAGDRDAAQRVKDMSENLARKMNGGVLPAPKELASFVQKFQQAQGKMEAQDTAAQLSQAANQLSKAMQNSAAQSQAKADGQKQQGGQQQQQGNQQQAGSQQQGNQSQQQANAQQQQGSQQQQQGGNQSNQQQSGHGQQQTASQQGKKGGGDQQQGNPGQSQMADAQQQMNDALNNAQGKEADTGGSMAGEGAGEGEGEADAGQWGQGDQAQGGQGGQGMGQGFSGPNQGGIGSGERPGKRTSPYTFKKEVDKGEMDEKGKVLSSSFVKGDSIKGESKEQVKQIIQSAQKDSAEDIDRDRVPMQAQEVVRKYFDSVQQDLK